MVKTLLNSFFVFPSLSLRIFLARRCTVIRLTDTKRHIGHVSSTQLKLSIWSELYFVSFAISIQHFTKPYEIVIKHWTFVYRKLDFLLACKFQWQIISYFFFYYCACRVRYVWCVSFFCFIYKTYLWENPVSHLIFMSLQKEHFKRNAGLAWSTSCSSSILSSNRETLRFHHMLLKMRERMTRVLEFS